jgi:ABC-type phosphate/phosphonate transport system permease subunit
VPGLETPVPPTATPTNTPIPPVPFTAEALPLVTAGPGGVVITPKPPQVMPITGQVVVMLVIGTVLSASAAIFLVGMFARRRKARDDEFNLY